MWNYKASSVTVVECGDRIFGSRCILWRSASWACGDGRSQSDHGQHKLIIFLQGLAEVKV